MASFELGKEIVKDFFSSCHERGPKQNILNRTSDLRITRSDDLPPVTLLYTRLTTKFIYDTRPAFC